MASPFFNLMRAGGGFRPRPRRPIVESDFAGDPGGDVAGGGPGDVAPINTGPLGGVSRGFPGRGGVVPPMMPPGQPPRPIFGRPLPTPPGGGGQPGGVVAGGNAPGMPSAPASPMQMGRLQRRMGSFGGGFAGRGVY